MRGGGPDGAPVVSSGMAARGRNHDRAGGRDGAVVRDRIGRDEPRATRRVRVFDPGPRAATARGAHETDPHERGDGPEKTQGAQHPAPPVTTIKRSPVSPQWHRA